MRRSGASGCWPEPRLGLQRLEQFLIYSDDAHRELATVNLLVQRNIPVTFAKPAAEVINETIKPEESPLVMKAIPVHASPKSSATRAKSRPTPPPTATPTVKRALPLQPFKKN